MSQKALTPAVRPIRRRVRRDVLQENIEVWLMMLPVLLVTVGFGLVGLTDDFLKVVLKHNEGLKPLPKFALCIYYSA